MDPILPPELEREIFEIAATIHPGTIPPLLRVARRVLTWIEPLLYRVIRVDADDAFRAAKAGAIMRAMHSKPTNFFADAVLHMFLDYNSEWTVDQACSLLSLCSNLVGLAVMGRYCTPSLLPILGTTQIRRFVGTLSELFGSYDAIDFDHPALASITHLHVVDAVNRMSELQVRRLASLPSLTHLALSIDVSGPILPQILSDGANLVVLFNFWVSANTARDALEIIPQTSPLKSDPRFILGVIPDDYWADWEIGAQAGADFWVEAGEFGAKKRRGEISGTVPLYLQCDIHCHPY
ncbi:hypothetical protein B0H13DRAFT_2297279 [Mycena leptocephala]|nr:hypothetical protein B0H13DRAFT_2297279 [Mycena leptocephala]